MKTNSGQTFSRFETGFPVTRAHNGRNVDKRDFSWRKRWYNIARHSRLGNIRETVTPGSYRAVFISACCSIRLFVIYSRCDECVTSRMEDSLRHSRSRINAYRALASPSLIALSSKDPILTAFELSWELRRLSFLEHEFKCEYQVKN